MYITWFSGPLVVRLYMYITWLSGSLVVGLYMYITCFKWISGC
jgi:hypothetical protein